MSKTKTIYFLIDCSESMRAHVDAVNKTMQMIFVDAFPEIILRKCEDLDMVLTVFGFSGDFPGNVKVLMEKTDIKDIDKWNDLDSSLFGGKTTIGAGIQAAIDDFFYGDYGPDDPAPAIILISDGKPDNGSPSYDEVMEKAVKGSPNEITRFRKTLRIAIGVNTDDAGIQSLQRFGANTLNARLTNKGVYTYYDCDEAFIGDLVTIFVDTPILATVGEDNE